MMMQSTIIIGRSSLIHSLIYTHTMSKCSNGMELLIMIIAHTQIQERGLVLAIVRNKVNTTRIFFLFHTI